MKIEHQQFILQECKDGEQRPFTSKTKIQWHIGKPLSYGVTPNGFPFIVWETREFGSILVGTSRNFKEPQSKLRNDCRSGVSLNDFDGRMRSAERMSKEIIY